MSIQRASPADLRKALEIANTLAKAGLLFIPMPVLSAEDASGLQRQAFERLDKLTQAAESTPE